MTAILITYFLVLLLLAASDGFTQGIDAADTRFGAVLYWVIAVFTAPFAFMVWGGYQLGNLLFPAPEEPSYGLHPRTRDDFLKDFADNDNYAPEDIIPIAEDD